MLAGFGLAQTLGPIAHILWLRTIRRADAVTVEAKVNSPVERPDAIVVPAGIDTEFFAPDGGDPVSGRVVAVGSLVPRKGFDILVSALAIAAPKNPSAHLIIAGSGPEKPELERLATTLGVASRITFWGQVPRRELPALYRSASLVCHPARMDNYPTVVLEAMACGIPVLVSTSGSLPELVGEAGLVHTVGDAEQLANQMLALLGDDTLRRELSTASRERAVNRHSFTVMSQRYLDIYRSLNAQKTLRL
jgi:glycosyltransferase involved in cell wall biosynthesis